MERPTQAMWQAYGRYNVLRHRYSSDDADSHPDDHDDWLFQAGPVLITWALSIWLPSDSPARWSARRLADHRLLYLDYQGPISGQRGAVQRREQGQYHLLQVCGSSCCLRLSGGRHGDLTISYETLDQGVSEWRFDFRPQGNVADPR